MYSTLDMMPVWIYYLIEKVVLTPQMTHEDDVIQFEQGVHLATKQVNLVLQICNTGIERVKTRNQQQFVFHYHDLHIRVRCLSNVTGLWRLEEIIVITFPL